MPTRRAALLAIAAPLFLHMPIQAAPADETPVQLNTVPGPFRPDASSLRTYKTPEWFRDAKFGIWSHWGPQSVPRAGDWYARNMYIYGTGQYKHHLEHYGHPSKHGYKDIIPLWKAEKFDPDALMALYKKAGARYFVSMGVHHDNFDLWDSKHHAWNAVKMGPQRDIVGDWKKAAQKAGLRFGVSEHLGASYAWWTPSHEYDQTWPMLGVDYDGADPKYASLYHRAHNQPYRGSSTWYTTDTRFHQEWFNRITDLVTRYEPDLLYTDGGIPFGEVGRTLVANFYNASVARHGGRLEAVYHHKDIGSGEFIREAGVQDVERGVMEGINPLPWQTDTSIGDWFYSEGYKYKSTTDVVHMLADIVSKNGNLLLNVVQYPDGSLPPEPMKFLQEMAEWMAVNGEAIYGTRPWKIFGEGPTKAASGHFREDTAYTPQDIRFTAKGGALYAITLGSPTGAVRIQSLGRKAGLEQRPVKAVTLLGSTAPLHWEQTADALVIQLPASLPSKMATSFRVSF
ncbi:alpha-L-fucosidase [Massilia endophytica]|uniref:alpha-L-fucosidase n=1 Tax=Massilia endophytica TaxID=2899220 RepID=UPI001E39686E|nr:alpha-L-fucosidase [Massilia endophytica]UGQ48791.1 alpha-L-fucosidase [Massilia endophytica]